MKKFLKYINSMPFAFTMRHYQIFGDSTSKMREGNLNRQESWDTLREDHPFFSISSNREEWLAASELAVKKDGQDSALIERAQAIVELIKKKNIEKVFSAGVGGAGLEYQIKKMMPYLPIVCSDYSAVTVETLKKVFIESDGIIRFDVLKGDWKEIQEKYIGEKGLCLMYRIDASFSDEEWKKIFKNLSDTNIINVLYVPTGTLTLLSIYNRKKRELKWFFKNIPIIFSGYIRTKKKFQHLWRNYYEETEIRFGGLSGFLLIKKN